MSCSAAFTSSRFLESTFFFPTATTQGISKPDLDSPTRSYSCWAPVPSAHSSRHDLEERDKSDNNTLLLKNWMDSFEIQDEEKACSPPTRKSMRRDRAQAGWCCLPSTLLAALLLLPMPVTLPFPALPVPHSLLHTVFSPPLSAYLAIWRTPFSCLSLREAFPDLSLHTSRHRALTFTNRPPQLSYASGDSLCLTGAHLSHQTPRCLPRLSSAPQLCTWHVSMHPSNDLFLVNSKNTSAYPSRQLKHHLLTSLRVPYLTQTTGACSGRSMTLFHKRTTMTALQGRRLLFCLVALTRLTFPAFYLRSIAAASKPCHSLAEQMKTLAVTNEVERADLSTL